MAFTLLLTNCMENHLARQNFPESLVNKRKSNRWNDEIETNGFSLEQSCILNETC
jgi:hypothetical protein